MCRILQYPCRISPILLEPARGSSARGTLDTVPVKGYRVSPNRGSLVCLTLRSTTYYVNYSDVVVMWTQWKASWFRGIPHSRPFFTLFSTSRPCVLNFFVSPPLASFRSVSGDVSFLADLNVWPGSCWGRFSEFPTLPQLFYIITPSYWPAKLFGTYFSESVTYLIILMRGPTHPVKNIVR